MTQELLHLISERWPWLILVGLAIIGTPHAIKSLKALKGFFWDPFVAHVRGVMPREDVEVRIADLEEQVKFLVEQVADLRYRDRMYWAWVLKDQEWHRETELLAVEMGWPLPKHQSFDDFYEHWTEKHPPPRESEN